jgi:hypothetical protein
MAFSSRKVIESQIQLAKYVEEVPDDEKENFVNIVGKLKGLNPTYTKVVENLISQIQKNPEQADIIIGKTVETGIRQIGSGLISGGTISLPKVQPGDLITADFMNKLIDAIAELYGAVGKQVGVQVRIDSLFPINTDRSGYREAYYQGEEVCIVGSNFDYTRGQTTTEVSVNAVPATILERASNTNIESSSFLLAVRLPQISSVVAERYTTAILTIKSRFGETSRTIVMNPIRPQ